MNLSRFIEGHRRDYKTALSEIKAGQKRSHWMWYIFPQIAGLGMSSTSVYYAIVDKEEAVAYLEDDILGRHMMELCEALMNLDTNDATEVFGYPDDMKLLSSMTLFEVAAPEKKIFGAVIEKFYNGKRDKKTLDILKKKK